MSPTGTSRDQPPPAPASPLPPGGEREDTVQGEGDYDAARRHREAATGFARDHDVERAAREAAPASPEEAQELLRSERAGRRHSRGEDRRDVMQEAAIDSPSDDKAT